MDAVSAACMIAVLAMAPGERTGQASSENFIVTAENQALAEELLATAEAYRHEIARHWLGEPLSPGVGRSIINYVHSDTADRATTWPATRGARNRHFLWMNTSRENALGATLAHELTHIVFAERFGERLPVWANEGAASLEDDPRTMAIRQRIVGDFVARGAWPNLIDLFEAATIAANDQRAYAAAVSVTQYLLTLGDRGTFLQFAESGKAAGWDQALRNHYGVANVRALEFAWRAWQTQTVNDRLAATGSRSPADVRYR